MIKRWDDAQTLIDRIAALRHPCDLDLLIFFVKHPHTLMGSEQLATFMGYDINQLACSLDVLLESGLITRSQTRAQVARLYVLATDGVHGGWLPALVKVASTPDGRQALMEVLKRRAAQGSGAGTTRVESRMGAKLRRPFLVRSTQDVEPPAGNTAHRRGGE